MKKPKTIPQLRFPSFEGEWSERKYRDIFSFRTTNSYSREDLNYESGITKNIHYGDIHTKFNTLFDIKKEVVPFVNNDISIKSNEGNLCKEGDLIIADASEDYEDVGKCIEIVNLHGEKVVSGLHTILARPDKTKMAIGFNGHLMQTGNVRLQIKTIAQGSKVLSISSNRLSEISLIVPTLPEQQKIAAFLTAVDERIRQLTRKKELLEKYKKGVMQKIFSRKIRFKDENGKSFPGWQKKVLGDVAKFTKGKGISKNDISETGTTECIRYGELYTHYNEVINIVYSKTALPIEGLILSEKNDVIIPSSGETQIDIAKASCVMKSGVALGGDLNIIKTDHNGIFLSYYLNNKKKVKIANLAQGVSVVHLYANKLSSLSIELPSLPEQNKIASFLTAIDNKIEQVNTQLENTKSWKKGLLQKMFV